MMSGIHEIFSNLGIIHYIEVAPESKLHELFFNAEIIHYKIRLERPAAGIKVMNKSQILNLYTTY